MSIEENKDDQETVIEATGEDNLTDPELVDIEEHSDQKLKVLRTKLQDCEREKGQYLEDLQRAKAEFLNSKKRLEEERQRDRERAVTDQIEKLLPLCDSFTMAMQNTDAWEAIDKEWRTGIEGIYSQLQAILTSYEVTVINPQGETFDPNQHEAMATQDSDQPAETILEVVQTGFARNNTIIRPAKVIISN